MPWSIIDMKRELGTITVHTLHFFTTKARLWTNKPN